MKKTLSIVLFVLLVFLAVACSPEHTHDYKLVPEKSLEATCTANGYNYMQCSCGAIQSIPTAVLGHDYVVDEERSSASTCIKKGNTYKVCSRCGDVKNVDLPLDPANHPFYYDKSANLSGDYVGVYESVKNAKVTTWPTCANDGEGVFTECTACGKTGEFKVTVSSSEFVKYLVAEENWNCAHVKMNEKGDGVTQLTADDIKEWRTDEEATAFTDGSETAYCPTCEKLIASDGETNTLVEKVVPFEKDKVLGFWTLKTATADVDKNYSIYYLTISKKNGSYSVSGYKMTVDANGKTSTKSENMEASWGTHAEDNGMLDKQNMIQFSSTVAGLGSNTNYEISEAVKSGKDALENDVAEKDLLFYDGSSYYRLTGNTKHVHTLTLMEDKRAVSGGLDDYTRGHYMECKDCGLKYVYENHVSGCEVCGWKDSWYAVIIGDGSAAGTLPSTNYDVYFVEEKPSIILSATGSYTYFDGAKKSSYSSVTPATFTFNFKSPSTGVASGTTKNNTTYTTSTKVLGILLN